MVRLRRSRSYDCLILLFPNQMKLILKGLKCLCVLETKLQLLWHTILIKYTYFTHFVHTHKKKSIKTSIDHGRHM